MTANQTWAAQRWARPVVLAVRWRRESVAVAAEPLRSADPVWRQASSSAVAAEALRLRLHRLEPCRPFPLATAVHSRHSVHTLSSTLAFSALPLPIPFAWLTIQREPWGGSELAAIAKVPV